MATDFSELKRSRKNSLQTLVQESSKLAGGPGSGQQQEDRFWKPQVDKSGNGYAVIRFLPAAKGDDLPWVRTFNHGFQGPGGWYIEESLTTIGKKDPVSEYNNMLWNSGIEANKDQARKQKRRLQYISNIYVVNDPSNPDNNGKVFLFKYGKKIWDKINDQMNPEFEDEDAVNPFDFWEGANFKMKIRNVEGYRNYDKSEFDAPSELFDGDDEKLETVYEGLYSLQDLVSPDKFKSYDELKQKLNKVLGLSGGSTQARPAVAVEEELPFDPEPQAKEAPAPKQKAVAATAEEDDDDLSFFEQLAND